ncbi:leucyl/phenylalanyl-tRNA--protein transferase [Microbulbifer sp. CAU 1566]|uniref:leucyl/phenylalanyl-tRNA--protein transferase n=1 Tax=Microbulbifer sp. CAU 1566 TaxID=2933269 RepID=UPI0020056ABD|nr:leucyl/phenylalanyl-tRNA--protein transferase [Microbulbifer sp. CAU 1566]MCK7596835.1 leucyl/phenylalanyl-tRNA--protein transferase [Microbulbifer sp. CAU 1566]
MTSSTDEILTLLDPDNIAFPETSKALDDPNGLLAVGGDLTPEWLLAAYRKGIFPWFSDDQPILWWSPSPRCVVRPQSLVFSRSLRKVIRQARYQVTFDQAFEAVLDGCAAPRASESGTWITDDMREAYLDMHQLGYAHSVETWSNGELVGGLYGLAIGKVFFGESMFHRATDASKVAFAYLVRQVAHWGGQLIDCQVSNPHLASLGAEEMSRADFESLLRTGLGDSANSADTEGTQEPEFPHLWPSSPSPELFESM